MFRKLAATAAVTAALISPSALSLGLGKIDAESGLNQPLRAEITLLSSRNVSEEDLRAKLASYDSYTKFGVQREAYHNTLSFRIITKDDGSKAIIVESREAIREPFINFLIELNWAQGRLMREYTLLLDPPVFAKTTPTPQPQTAPTTRRQTTVNNQPTEPEQVSRATETSTDSASESTASSRDSQPEVTEKTRQIASTPAFNDDSWTVERGQTLWSIAKSVRPEGVSVQQTLLAIFHNNPEAFINNDINRMKAGAVLTVPERSTISNVSQSTAVNTIRNATVSDEAPLDVRKTVDETKVDDSESQGGRLSIASVDDGASEQSSGSALDDDATGDLAESKNASSDNATESGDSSSEFGTELSETEAATDDGLAVEDETLSVLSGAADAADETDEIGVNEPAAEIAEDSLAQSSSTDSDTENTSSTDESLTVDNEAEPEDSAASEPEVANNSLQQNADKPFYEAENFWLYAGGGLVILFLIGGGIIYRRNSKEVEDDGGLLGMMAAANETKPKKKRESFISNEGLKAPKEEADPVSSADILIARGKLSKAESVLEDALAAEPNNQEIRVKLMEVVASQQNTEKFFQLKNELPADFDHDSTLGLKVASLTSLVTPDNRNTEIDSGSDELNLPSEDDIFGDEDKEPVDLDLSDELEGSGADVETVSDDNSLDLDLGDFEKQVEESSAESKTVEDNAIDFSSSQDDEDIVTQEDDSTTNDVVDDSQSQGSGAGLSDDDAATKFDLANAYMELGDDDAARDILEEIKSEGNSAQRAEADKLLASM